jgi:hypothetical protein
MGAIRMSTRRLIILLGLAATAAPGATAPRRADSFLGIHFDFHAGPDCTNVGARTTREMVTAVIDKVRPDYIQIDGKGHPGYSSYPTKVGNPAPGIVGDPLRTWRDVTRERGVALFLHYSGVWDSHAVKTHPEWAARHPDGHPDDNATSVFGPYADALMIPQLRELAGEYGVDGVWVDGDCWGAMADYGDPVKAAFQAQTGAAAVPQNGNEPLWNEWLDFNREGYRRYLRHYVDALKASHPKFEVISNWAFSDHMPEPVSAGVTALSGDFSPDDSVNSARFSGRCMESQGRPWDLMSWSFSREPRRQKTAAQLQREAAIVLALGGGYQAYFTQTREGAVRLPELDVMAEVAHFCRERQRFCHHSEAIPQIALLYSTTGHYRSSPRLFHPSGGDGLPILKQALGALLGNGQAVQILSEHHLRGRLSRWPLVVVPGWSQLDPAFRDEMGAYAKAGGKLLLIGDGPAKLFAAEQAAQPDAVTLVSAVDGGFLPAVRKLFPAPLVTVAGASDIDVSPRRLGGKLQVHLVNTTGQPAGPITASIRVPKAPAAVTLQPEGTKLDLKWEDGVAAVTVPRLDIYSILEVTDQRQKNRAKGKRP